MSALRTCLRLSWHDRLLLVESTLRLACAAAAVAMLPFRHIAGMASRPLRRSEPAPDVRIAMVRRVRWAVRATARRVPWPAVCYQQGLAAHWMLRRRGIPSLLYYGAAPDPDAGLAAHVWVRDGDIDVVGGEIAERYAVLATFPPQVGGPADRSKDFRAPTNSATSRLS